jgi:hypothetical protein
MGTPWIVCVSAFMVFAAQGMPFQNSTLANATPSKLTIEVSVERRHGAQWSVVDPRTVFHNGDEIKFRFHTSLRGHLYVLNHSSDDMNTWLFPISERGERSLVEPGREYMIPGAQGSFAVTGRPGFDIVYWMLSPIAIDTGEAAPPTPGSLPDTLEPRCRSEVLKARGQCIDERAGARPLIQQQEVPLESLRASPLVSRELSFRANERSTRISAANPHSGVIIYEFRIAHN